MTTSFPPGGFGLSRSTQQWDYKVEVQRVEYPEPDDLEETWIFRLDELGSEGWELVNCHYSSSEPGAPYWKEVRGTFKRPRP